MEHLTVSFLTLAVEYELVERLNILNSTDPFRTSKLVLYFSMFLRLGTKTYYLCFLLTIITYHLRKLRPGEEQMSKLVSLPLCSTFRFL